MAVAVAGLGDMPTTRLVGKGQATLENLSTNLSQGFDVVYIVAHGAFVKGRAMLYLEDSEGDADVVSGVQLAAAIARRLTMPRLVVLASCQSAGSGTSGAMAAVGPLLAREGVPAVLAMQGKISIETAAPFMVRFFEELGTDGQIDRAVAVARGEARRRDRTDAWMPVLYTRLNSGCIWTMPVRSKPQWDLDSVLDMIDEGRCVPILGAGITEFLLGSQQEIAQRWADTYRFPMAAHVRRDLPQVAQYLGVTQRDPQFPRRQLQKYLALEMRKRYPNQLANLRSDLPLDELIQQVGRERRGVDPAEPFRVLAELPLKMYITTTPDNLLTDALTEAGRKPAVDLFHWTSDDEVEWPPSVFKDRPDYRTTQAEPLVYHLFGRLAERDSVVLTEDDYFQYLVAISQGDNPIPACVSRSWNDDTLLFLGFRVDDWHFRVLFQSIMKQQGSLRRKQRPHVAVQLDIEDGGSTDPERARDYLERYFGFEHINIYWGSCEKFIREIADLWAIRHPSNTAAGRVLAATARP
ncbi:MAG: CHAT domain-containing protein [Chloroflexi bacterium]|nr:CHAT domain-containing protein [Chloroflexota bacterium]